MHPLLLILLAFVCILGFLGFVALALDNWRRGNRGFALFALGLAAFCIWALETAMHATEAAYVQRTGGQP